MSSLNETTKKEIQSYWNKRILNPKKKQKDINDIIYHRIDALLLSLYYSSECYGKSFKDICKENKIDYNELQEMRFEK